MSPAPPLSNRTEIRALLSLGAPAVMTQLGAMLLGVVDTMMLGRLGVIEMDAAALGNIWLFGTLVVPMGILQGMDPIVSQAWGARDRRTVGRSLHHALLTAALCSVPVALAWWGTEPVLRLWGQDPQLAALADTYVRAQIPSILPFLGFFALRQHLQGQGIVAPGVWVMALGNVFNVVANRWLIWGGLGLAPLGLTGAAAATGLTRVLLLLLLILWIHFGRLYRTTWVPWSRASFSLGGLAPIWRHGWPVALQFGLEVWAFQASTVLAGRLGTAPLAAHVAVLNLASLSFMVPLGLSIGAATRVGHLIGRRDFPRARRSARLALGLGASVMLFSALLFSLGREILPHAYSRDPTVLALSTDLLPIAAAFQLFDGTQAVGSGVLRGMGAPLPAAVFNLVGYYALALPLGIWLAFQQGWGIQGLWWGLAVGVAVVAIALTLWILRRGHRIEPIVPAPAVTP